MYDKREVVLAIHKSIMQRGRPLAPGELVKMFTISRPEAEERIEELIRTGYLERNARGPNRNIRLTEKGHRLANEPTLEDMVKAVKEAEACKGLLIRTLLTLKTFTPNSPLIKDIERMVGAS